MKDSNNINENSNDKNTTIIAKAYDIYNKYKESINYLFFGVVVTIVNFLVYIICTKLFHIDEIISNIISFVFAVTVAYITNKKYVFESKTEGFLDSFKEFFEFVSSRIITSGVFDVGLFAVLLNVVSMNDILAKLICEILIVVSNYLIGKFVVFNTDSDGNKKDYIFKMQNKYGAGKVTFLISLIVTIFTVICLKLDFDIAKNSYIMTGDALLELILTIIIIYNSYMIIYKKKKQNLPTERLNIYTAIGGLLFGLVYTFGKLTENVLFDAKVVITNKLILYIVFNIISYYILFKNILVIVFNFIDNMRVKIAEKNRSMNGYNENEKGKAKAKEEKNNTTKKKWYNILENDAKSFIIVTLVFMVFWIPMFLTTYPGIVSFDNLQQLIQGVTKTFSNAHPIFHSYVLYSIVELGKNIFGSYNAGFALFTVIHMLLFAMTLSYILKYLAKKNVPFVIRAVLFTFFLLYPPIANHSIILNKDIMCSLSFVIVVIQLIEMSQDIRKYFSKPGNIIVLFFFILLSVFLRHNVAYAYIVALPIMAIIILGQNRKNKKDAKKKGESVRGIGIYILYVLLLFIIPIIIHSVTISVLTKKYNVAPALSQDKFSIPIQIIGRNAKYNSDELSEFEHDAILNFFNKHGVLNTIEDIGSTYNPAISDPLKQYFIVDGPTEKREFIAVMIGLLKKFPEDCIQAVLSHTHIYYYPGRTITIPSFSVVDHGFAGQEELVAELNVHLDNVIDKENIVRDFLIDTYYGNVPVLSIPVSIAYVVAIMVFAVLYILYSRKYIELLPYTICFGIYISCLFSPVNGEFRYAFPVYLSVFVLIPMLFSKTAINKDRR